MIPKVSQPALAEAIQQLSKPVSMTPKQAQVYLDKYTKEFKERQPEIMNYAIHNVRYIMKHNKGLLKADTIIMHIAVVLNSLYIQDEIDEVKKIFDAG